MGVVTVSKPSTNMIVLGKGDSDRITVSFRYDPQRVEKVKTIHGRKWHPEEKHWNFPNTDGTLEKILDVFKDEEIHYEVKRPTKDKKLPTTLNKEEITRIIQAMKNIKHKAILMTIYSGVLNWTESTGTAGRLQRNRQFGVR